MYFQASNAVNDGDGNEDAEEMLTGVITSITIIFVLSLILIIVVRIYKKKVQQKKLKKLSYIEMKNPIYKPTTTAL